MYTLSTAPYELDYLAQIGTKFKMDVKHISDLKELKKLVSLNIHSWRVFKDGLRGGINVLGVTAAVLDFDDGTTIKEFEKSSLGKYKYILYTSRNHNIAKGDTAAKERFHIAFPFSEIVKDFKVYSGLQEGIIDIALAEGLKPDIQVKDLARVFFPSRSNNIPEPTSNFVFMDGGNTYIDKDIAKVSKDTSTLTRDKVTSILNNLDANKVKSCVKFLEAYNTSTGLSYSQWVRVAASLHDVENGYDYFETISRSYIGKISNNEIVSKWRDTSNIRNIKIGTLFYIAYGLGWTYNPIMKYESNNNDKVDMVIKKLEETFNKNLNADMCQLVLVGNKFKLVSAGYRFRKYYINTSDVPSSALFIDIPTKEKALFKDILMEKMINTRYLAKEPYLEISAGLQEGTPVNLYTLEKMLKRESYSITAFDAFTGKLEVVAPVVPGDMYDTEAADYVERILSRIFSTGNYNYLPIIKKFLAQLVFEKRTKARASLVLTGARGTGKSFFINYIAGAFYDDSCKVYMQNGFNEWAEATKIISVEESGEEKGNLKRLYNEIKDHSGSSDITVNKKFQNTYKAPSTSYFIISTNDEFGFYIGDSGASNEQFIVIEFNESQVMKDDDITWHGLGINTEKIRKSLKAYAYHYLRPIYVEMVENESGFRYGFNTKIKTSGLEKLRYNSRSFNDETFEEIEDIIINLMEGVGLDDIWKYSRVNYNIFNKAVSMLEDGFITSDLLRAILDSTKVKIKKNRIKSHIESTGISVTNKSMRVLNKILRGWKTDWPKTLKAKFKKDLDNNYSNTVVSREDLDDYDPSWE